MYLRPRSGARESGLCFDGDCTAECVEAEQRVGPRHQVDRLDGGIGNERPVDCIAERLIDPHAVLVHGYALRQPEKRGADEATVLDVRLQRIVLRFVDEYAREVPLHEIRKIQRPLLAKFLGRCRLHVGSDAIRIDTGA